MSKLRAVTMTDIEESFVAEMKEKNGWGFSDTVHRAMDEFRRKQTPDYIKIREKQQDIRERQLALTEQGKAMTKRQLSAKDQALSICSAFGGKVSDDGLYCVYTNYWELMTKDRISTEQVPLSKLDDSYKQYHPSKEEYLAFCAKWNKDPYKL